MLSIVRKVIISQFQVEAKEVIQHIGLDLASLALATILKITLVSFCSVARAIVFLWCIYQWHFLYYFSATTNFNNLLVVSAIFCCLMKNTFHKQCLVLCLMHSFYDQVRQNRDSFRPVRMYMGGMHLPMFSMCTCSVCTSLEICR